MQSLLTFAMEITSMIFAHANWMTNYQAALVQAKAQKKKVLLNFTCSDLCEFCRQLDADVFSQPVFKNFAEKNYILVKVDFPLQKPLADELKEQNQALDQQFQVQGYPTLIVLDADEKELKRAVGYRIGTSPDAVIAKLSSFKKA